MRLRVLCMVLATFVAASCAARTAQTPEQEQAQKVRQLTQTKAAIQDALDALPLLDDLLSTAVATDRISEESAAELRRLGTEAHGYLTAALDVAEGIDDPGDAQQVLRSALTGTAVGIEQALDIVPTESLRLREVLGLVSIAIRATLIFV